MIEAQFSKAFHHTHRDENPFALNLQLQLETNITVLLGSSGSGKTSTLNCLAGFVSPDSGRILLRGRLLYDSTASVHVAPQHRRIGYIFQDHALFPHMTIRDNLLYAASVARPDVKRPAPVQRRRRAADLLDKFKLAPYADQRPAKLSGGQRQRAALARVLISQPECLLLDEPTQALDAQLRSDFYQLLREVQAELNIPVVLVTHDVTECFELADHVIVLDEGTAAQEGPAHQVFSRPHTVDIARTLGIFNVIEAQIDSLDPGRDTADVRVLDQRLRTCYLPGHLIGDRGHICIRQSEFNLLTGPPDVNHTNRLRLTLAGSDAAPEGRKLRFNDGLIAFVPDSVSTALRERDTVTVYVPPDSIHFIG